MAFNHAVMWYCLSAIKYINNLSEEEVKEIGFEIGLKGSSGFDMDNPKKKYHIDSLGKDLTGLQAVSWMYVTWQNIDSSRDIGLDFSNEYKTAKNLFDKENEVDKEIEDEIKTYILSFDELNINEEMSETEMLLKAVKYFGFEEARTVTIEAKKNEKMVIVETLEFPKIMTRNDEELFKQALDSAQKGKIDFALEKFKYLSNKYKYNTKILENIARCYLEINKLEDAVSYYKKALKYEESTYSHIGIGNAFSRLGNKEEAIKHYEKAIELEPDYALSYNNLAAAYSEVGRNDEAEENFLKAIEMDPENPQTLYGIGLLYSKIGKLKEAKEYLLKAEKKEEKLEYLKPHIKETMDIIEGVKRKEKKEKNNPIENEDLKKIIKLSEEISGKKFEYTIRNDMVQYAGIKIARKDDSHHLIYYKGENTKILQHLIAHECGHLIRTYKADEEDRVVSATNKHTMELAYIDMQEDIENLAKKLPEEKTAEILKMLYEGTVRQVTNYPADIIIEKWIYDNYPKLRKQQLESIEKQAKEAMEGLKTESDLIPEKIRYCSNVMNYAFFRIIGYHIKHNFIKPFSGTRYLNAGKELTEMTEKEYINNFNGDVEMTKKWAKFLNIEKWFMWVDFEKNK